MIDAILSSYSSKSFNSEPVSEDEIEMVLRCGNKAPSARNSQTWKYTVVKDNALAKEIVRDAMPGNVIIVVSGPEAGQPGMNADIDCTLSVAYMYMAAQGLGLAAHLYTSPIRKINESLKEQLEIPSGYRAVIVMKMGNTESYVDGVSSASARNALEEVVTYK